MGRSRYVKCLCDNLVPVITKSWHWRLRPQMLNTCVCHRKKQFYVFLGQETRIQGRQPKKKKRGRELLFLFQGSPSLAPRPLPGSVRCVSPPATTSCSCVRSSLRTLSPRRSRAGSGLGWVRSSRERCRTRTLRWMDADAGREPCCCLTTTKSRIFPAYAGEHDVQAKSLSPSLVIFPHEVQEMSLQSIQCVHNVVFWPVFWTYFGFLKKKKKTRTDASACLKRP